LTVLAREAQKRETGSIRSGGDLRVIWVVSGPESVIQRISGFHLNSRVLTFHLNVTFLCKFRRIRDLGCAQEFLNVVNSVPGHFCVN